MEMRNVKPYFSSLKLVLNDGVVEVPVQNQQTGQHGIALKNEERQISCNITGWISNTIEPDLVLSNDPTTADVSLNQSRVVLNTTTGKKARWKNVNGVLNSIDIVDPAPIVVRSDTFSFFNTLPDITLAGDPTAVDVPAGQKKVALNSTTGKKKRWTNVDGVLTSVDILPSVDEVLSIASAMGVDVVAAWNSAFDEIVNNFPQTRDQPAGSESIGPPVYFRPDAFLANLHPTQKKSVVIKVGVYSEAKEVNSVLEYSRLQTYITLVFEDGETKRERETNIANHQQSRIRLQADLDALNTLIAIKEANQAVPANTYQQHLVSQSVEQLMGVRMQIEQDIKYRTAQINELQSLITGKLSDLLGGNGENDTPLQVSVKASVAALCAAILETLKASNPDYAGIDVAAIMAGFSIPTLD